MQLNNKKIFANIDDELILGLRERYSSIHPLLFIRSIERANSVSDLVDILKNVPNFPIVWNSEQRRWITTDLLISND